MSSYYPCENYDCIHYQEWKQEMPYVIYQDNVNITLICFACKSFVRELINEKTNYKKKIKIKSA